MSLRGLSLTAAVALAALLPITPPPVAVAETARVLHVAFDTAETSFDPQALNELAQPWLKGFKPDPLLRYQWKFYDVAPR